VENAAEVSHDQIPRNCERYITERLRAVVRLATYGNKNSDNSALAPGDQGNLVFAPIIKRMDDRLTDFNGAIRKIPLKRAIGVWRNGTQVCRLAEFRAAGSLDLNFALRRRKKEPTEKRCVSRKSATNVRPNQRGQENDAK